MPNALRAILRYIGIYQTPIGGIYRASREGSPGPPLGADPLSTKSLYTRARARKKENGPQIPGIPGFGAHLLQIQGSQDLGLPIRSPDRGD